MTVPLWLRGKFFDSYGERPNEQEAALPPGGIRFACPCCGYPTLGERGMDQICELCWWEDDGQDSDNADEIRVGPNRGFSLTEAQQNFELYLVKYLPDKDTRIGGPDSEAEREAKRIMISAFDRMLDEPSPQELDALWAEVKTCERALYRSLKLNRMGNP